MRVSKNNNESTLIEWKKSIDKSIPTPLYYQLKLLIKSYIESDKFKAGSPLPTESEMSRVLEISRPTIRQCMQELVSEGFLTRQKGKGTFVNRQRIEMNYIAKHESFEQIIRNHGYIPNTQVLDFRQISPNPRINEILEIALNEPLYYLKRLCLANDAPILLTESYTQATRFPGLLQYDFSKVSLYKTFEKIYKDKVNFIRREVGAAGANTSDAVMLNIPRSRAICMVYNLAFDLKHKPIEYSVSRYRSETIKFTSYLEC